MTAAVLSLLTLPACLLGPGLLVAGRLRWSPAERLAGAVLASLIALELATWGLWLLRAPAWTSWLVTAACVACLTLGARELRRLLASRSVRRLLGAFAALAAWCLLIALCIRQVSGGLWVSDWYEHFERSRFFATPGASPGTTFLPGVEYALTARPPFMNVLGAHVLRQSGARYDVHQAAFVLLNVLAFLPAALLAGLFGRRGLAACGTLAALLALNPSFVQNATFGWTKLLAAFGVLLGLFLHVRGLRKDDPTRLAAAYAALAVGVLVHYSACVPAVILGAHLLWSRRSGWRSLAAILAPAAALLATWLLWALVTYGAAGTFATNTTVATPSEESLLLRAALNLKDTLVPHWFRTAPDALAPLDVQESAWGWWRDFFFLPAQQGLLPMIGWVAGPVAAWLLVRHPREGGFPWAFAGVAMIVLGTAVVPGRETLGSAHLALQPLVLAAIALIAAALPSLSRGLRVAIVAGAIAGSVPGVLLHVAVQAQPRVAYEERISDELVERKATGGLAAPSLGNVLAKLLSGPFAGDHVPDKRPPAALVAVGWAASSIVLLRAARRGAPPARVM